MIREEREVGCADSTTLSGGGVGGKRRIAWGITGSGHRLTRTVRTMKEVEEQYRDKVRITVYLSKAGRQVVEYYDLTDYITENFEDVRVEVDSNQPFLAGALQLGGFEFLLIAPATSNTVAKISMGIADSLISNSAIMAMKAMLPVYIMPSDIREGITVTNIPGGRDLKLRIRREDVEHVKKLGRMERVFILEEMNELRQVFQRHFKPDDDQ